MVQKTIKHPKILRAETLTEPNWSQGGGSNVNNHALQQWYVEEHL